MINKIFDSNEKEEMYWVAQRNDKSGFREFVPHKFVKWFAQRTLKIFRR
jgi:hypothetical protein